MVPVSQPPGRAGKRPLVGSWARYDSLVLMALFTIWVLSPFVALVLAEVVAKRWSVLTRATLHGVMLIVTLGSLAIYGSVAVGPPRSKPAFMFLVVPFGSWLLVAIAVGIAAAGLPDDLGAAIRKGD